MEKWISLYGTFKHEENKIKFDGGTITNNVDLTKHLTGGALIFKPTKMKIIRQTKIKEIEIFPVERPAA